MGLPLGESTFLVVSHEATVASNVGRKNGGEPPPYGFAGQRHASGISRSAFKLRIGDGSIITDGCDLGQQKAATLLCDRWVFATRLPAGTRKATNAADLESQDAWSSPLWRSRSSNRVDRLSP